MRWRKLLERYALVKRPVLKAMNPRVGTSVIPLDLEDSYIFFQYLTNKMHALTFEGPELQLTQIIHKLKEEKGFTIEKIKISAGRGHQRLMLVHLKFPNNVELRRLIKLI